MNDESESTAVKIAKIETSLEAVQTTLQTLTRQCEMLNMGNQETQKLFGRLEQLLSSQETKNSQIQSAFNQHEQENAAEILAIRDKLSRIEIAMAQDKATVYGVISGVRRTHAVVSGCIAIIVTLLSFIFTEKFDMVRDMQHQIGTVAMQISNHIAAEKGKER